MAVITGLGGMGKTALTAEALALWESRFEWVLLYQAKPNALGFDATLRDIHMKLNAELGRYHEHVKAHPADAIHRAADGDFTGQERLDRLTRNLIRALSDEPILLVLDNFETNLKPQAKPGTTAEPLWACQDPAWDRCLARLATELVGKVSRVLITCRRPLAALAGTASHSRSSRPAAAGRGGALPVGARGPEQDGLRRGCVGKGPRPAAAGRQPFPPAAHGPPCPAGNRRPGAATSTDAGTRRPGEEPRPLPAPHLFATNPGDAKELAYLDDALATSLDQLIRDASPDARRLLWMIAVANEPVTWTSESVWSGESLQEQRAQQRDAAAGCRVDGGG